MTSPTTKSSLTGSQESLKPSTPLNTSSDATNDGPWRHPELEINPEFVLDSLRECQHMINSLEAKKKQYKGEIQQLYDQGALAHLVDDMDSQKYNGDGVSIALCKGRKTRIYDNAVQMEIEVKLKEIEKIKYVADRKEQFTDKFAPSYWRVNLGTGKE
jgi:hypothetical protein